MKRTHFILSHVLCCPELYRVKLEIISNARVLSDMGLLLRIRSFIQRDSFQSRQQVMISLNQQASDHHFYTAHESLCFRNIHIFIRKNIFKTLRNTLY